MADIEISHLHHCDSTAVRNPLGVVAGAYALVGENSAECIDCLAVGFTANGARVLFIVGDGAERPVGPVFRFARLGYFGFYLQGVAHRLDFLLDSVCGATFAKCL